MVELAYTKDLKSFESEISCGFESRQAYMKNLGYMVILAILLIFIENQIINAYYLNDTWIEMLFFPFNLIIVVLFGVNNSPPPAKTKHQLLKEELKGKDDA